MEITDPEDVTGIMKPVALAMTAYSKLIFEPSAKFVTMAASSAKSWRSPTLPSSRGVRPGPLTQR
jgi:hypothetical protein